MPVEVIKDEVGKTFQALRELMGKQVLVGIPADKDKRDDSGAMNNASIAYVMEFGSPAQNIPARAFLIPGVEKARAAAVKQLKLAAAAALEGNTSRMMAALNSAGTIGSNSVRNEILTGDFAPLKPSTIANRHRARGKESGMRRSEIDYLRFVAAGVDPAAAQAETGIRPLVNTGQMFRSITYVIQDFK